MHDFDAVHRLGQPNDEVRTWARSIHALSSALRARGADAGTVIAVILEPDSGLLHDERLAVPLQRLARAGVLPDQNLSHIAASP